jgi:hypothetical protein
MENPRPSADLSEYPQFLFLYCCSLQLHYHNKLPVRTKKESLKLQRQRLQAISMIKQSAGEEPLWDNNSRSITGDVR